MLYRSEVRTYWNSISVFLALFLLLGTVRMHAQCYPDRHSTTWSDGWVSCEAFPSPNPARGTGHWILYDFKDVYRLFETHIWNTNDPTNLERGLQDVAIDYSLDGNSWLEVGEYTWEPGLGSSVYEGFGGPDLSGIEARFLLITGLSNYGGDCYGFSELRLSAEAVEGPLTGVEEHAPGSSCLNLTVFPNPFTYKSKMMIQSQCADPISYTISDIVGRRYLAAEVRDPLAIQQLNIDGRDLPVGTYVIHMRQGNQSVRQKFLKVE